ncbi:hypothetical protein [Streptomyces sp. NPDC018031]|uniref:hypothetical protein n=1 Tax=Streptomyces sp. NPDC018031 TaxID=3365033 RepID=UPI00378EF075
MPTEAADLADEAPARGPGAAGAVRAGGALSRPLLWPLMGNLLESGEPGGPVRLRLYVAGDTLLFPGIEEIAHRCPEIHLAVVHLGGTRLPSGGLLVTMDAAQGARLVRTVRRRRVTPCTTRTTRSCGHHWRNS